MYWRRFDGWLAERSSFWRRYAPRSSGNWSQAAFAPISSETIDHGVSLEIGANLA
jgi:hypothetical protein